MNHMPDEVATAKSAGAGSGCSGNDHYIFIGYDCDLTIPRNSGRMMLLII